MYVVLRLEMTNYSLDLLDLKMSCKWFRPSGKLGRCFL
jgi:hypothetical protein